MPTDDLLNAALAYAAAGWPVFPLAPRSKIPRKGSHGFQDATTDVAQVRRWWTADLNANIGVPTGAASGMVALDVDPRHGGDVTLDALLAKNGQLPDTLEQITGGGGRHFCFAYDPAFGNGNRKFGSGVDAKGDGGYILVSPSIHPDGPVYAWEGGEGPESKPLAQLPDWLKGPAPVLLNADGTGNLNFDATQVQIKADGAPVAPGGRNVAAASLAGQYVHSGDSVAAVLRKVKAWNAANPVPLADAEIEQTVASVARTHAAKNPGAAVPIGDEPVQQVDVGPNSDQATSPDPVADPLPAPQQAVAFPDRLLNVPGFVGEICGWINDTAYKPQPVLTLANVLAFFGAVVGRKVRTPSDLRTNLYCLGVGESGSGKDHSRKQVKRLCKAAGLTSDLMGGEEVSSDTAITAALFEHPSLLFQFDEIGHLLAQANNRNAQSHQKNIAPTLTKLFSSANTTYLGKAMASKSRKDIEQPNACLYGTTVANRLYEGLTLSEVTDGFLGRMLVFKSDDPDPAERQVTLGDVPENIVTMVKAWFQRKLPPAPPGSGNLFQQEPLVVPLDGEANAKFSAFSCHCRERKAHQRAEGRGMDALWARAMEHASKLALIVACGVEFVQPVVTGDIAAWAIELVDHLTNQLIETVSDHVASSDFERELNHVKHQIATAGQTGVTTTRLARITQRVKPQQRTEILNQLVASGRVAKRETKPARGPAAIAYYVTGR